MPHTNHAVILVNGKFPHHPLPLEKLRTAPFLICCDGSINKLHKHHLVPNIIIGDMDSASTSLKKKYASKIIHLREQESCDQTKAVHWAMEQGFTSLDIVGAGGKREDHCIANCFLLFHYFEKIATTLYTNHGIFSCSKGTQIFESHLGQQVSIFSPYGAHIQSDQLKYPLNQLHLKHLWEGTLNESQAATFTLSSNLPILVFRSFSMSI